jgi:dihydroneopterin aldolase / 2-amino-4-hydroxy-6-hydroxymethyldihydropteridine diphosphokinase
MTLPDFGPVLGRAGRPLDQIQLIGLTARGYHGVFPDERRDGQDFVVDAVLHLDTTAAAGSDDLAETVNYGALAVRIADVVRGEPVDLIETLAARIAENCLASADAARVVAVDVTVHKPQAPITEPFTDVLVAIRRDRADLGISADRRVRSGELGRSGELDPSDRSGELGRSGELDPSDRSGELGRSGELDPSDRSGELGRSGELDRPSAGSAAPGQLDRRPAEPVTAVLALGTNLGDRAATLRAALAHLREVEDLAVELVSPVVETDPVGGPDQPAYLNAVVLVSTGLTARELLLAGQRIENRLGRERTVRWGPRTLDIDVVRYGELLSSDPELILPHPRAQQRAFVLVPWLAADPQAWLPTPSGRRPVAPLPAVAPDRQGVRDRPDLRLDPPADPATATAPVTESSVG